MPFKRILILALVLYITFIGGTAYTANNAVLRIVLHLTATLLATGWIWTLYRQQRSWPRTPLDGPLLMIVIWFGVATLASHNMRVSLEQAWPFLMHILWFYILVDVIRQGQQRWVFEALFMAAGVIIIVSVVEITSWYFGLGFAGFNQGWFQIGGFSLPPGQRYKLSLALNVSTILGNYAAVLLPLIFGWSLSVERDDHRLGLRLLSLGMLVVLIGTGSRGGLAAFVAAVGLMVGFGLIRWQQTRAVIQPRLILIGMALGILAIGVALILFAMQSDSTSDQRRVDMWEDALDMAEADPLTGVGIFQFGTAYRETRNKDFIQDKIVAAHNLWMNTVAEMGVPGLLLLLWLGGTFGMVWWRQWQAASAGYQIRLEAILAALVAFNIHSLIDTFTLSSSVLPILIAGAYVVAPVEPVRGSLAKVYRWSRLFVVGIVVVYLGWLLRVDVAEIRFLLGLGNINDEKYTEALEGIKRAESLDPQLDLYPLAHAYVLGLMAEEDPDTYLAAAIDAHRDTLTDNPTFDLGHANLSVLYAEQGNYESAIRHIIIALEIHPDVWQYWLKLAEYQEATGQYDVAVQSYLEALTLEPDIARSAYWDSTHHPARQDGLEVAYDEFGPARQTILALHRNWEDRASDASARIAPNQEVLRHRARARYAVDHNDFEIAIDWYGKAIELEDPSELPELYAERAEVYWMLGQVDEAEQDARTAVFLNRVTGARGYYVLALIELQNDDATPDEINQLLADGVIPRVIVSEYSAAVYGHLALFDFLPQMRLPGQGEAAYAPWFLLAERYASDNDDETNPADVYEAILDSDPYVEMSQIQLELLDESE